MKKILALFLFTFFSFSGLMAQDEGIVFTTDKSFDEVLAKAKAENKYIFMDAYAEWCGPCKWIAKNIFPLPEVGQYFNSRFVSVQIDMEKGEGPALANKYQVQAYPTLLFLNSKGEMVHRVVGAVDGPKLIDAAEIAADPEKNLAGMQKKYEKNKTNPDFLVEYLNLLDAAYMDKNTVLNAYFETQQESDLISEGNWKIMNAHLTNSKSREFKYLVEHKQDFVKKYNKQQVCDKIYNIHLEDMINVLRNPQVTTLYPTAKKDFDAKYERRAELLAQTDMLYYQYIEQNEEKFAESSEQFLDLTQSKDPEMFNSVAWDYYEKVNDPARLKKAKAWAKKAMDISPKSHIIDTYSALCKKLEQYDEALKYAEKALAKAKEEGAELAPFEENIKEIKAKM